MKPVRRLWEALKAELKVALKTFAVAWLVLTAGLVALTVVKQAHGAHDVVAMLTLGVVVCAVYTLWPALAVATCRVVYRLLGVGAYVGALLSLGGVVTSLVLFRNVFLSLFIEIFDAATFSGPCGGHAGGPAAVLALFCVVLAVLGSPGSWWALLKLFLAVSCAILLGSLPGMLLWLVLLVRKVAKLASASISR